MSDPFVPHKEPEEVFSSLNSRQYADFYALEMDTFAADIDFYREQCGPGSSVLELACGTGRICSRLASCGHPAVGLDISRSMLLRARRRQGGTPLYVCMDMTRMAFRHSFDHILIPYNSLNLLKTKARIGQCLRQCRRLLNPGGTLLLQLHVPGPELTGQPGERFFQFQIFPLADGGGKLIKETLRCYLPEKNEIHLEERYRVRPLPGMGERQDYQHHLYLAGFSHEQWLTLLQINGFRNFSLYGDYDCRAFQGERDSRLLLQAHPA